VEEQCGRLGGAGAHLWSKGRASRTRAAPGSCWWHRPAHARRSGSPVECLVEHVGPQGAERQGHGAVQAGTMGNPQSKTRPLDLKPWTPNSKP